MTLAVALDQSSLYIVIALLVFLIVVFAIVKGRSVKLWFKKAGLQVGEAAKETPAAQAGGQNISVLDSAKVSDGSHVEVQVGNRSSVQYAAPEKKEKPPRK